MDAGSSYDLGAKFEVLGVLGRGGMGTVLAVRHVEMDRQRAVKLLHVEGVKRDPAILERFRREATIASDLHHPNIVRVFDFDRAPSGDPYIVMERLEGENLHELIYREGAQPVDRTIALLRGAADALDKVHDLGIVHRDLKPANLFLTREGVVKILDFGISHVETDGAALTQTGDVLGTPAFMAPEQLHGTGIDRRVDVYALAAVAYELLTGRHAFEATNPAALVAFILEGKRVPASRHVPDLPVHVEAALEKGMAIQAAERFERVGDLLAALGGGGDRAATGTAADDLATGPTVLSTERPPARPKPGRLKTTAVGIAVISAVGIAATALWLRKAPEETVAALSFTVAPARVDVPGAETEWLSTAVSSLLEWHLALDPRAELVDAKDVSERLGAKWHPIAADESDTGIQELAREAKAGAIVVPVLDGHVGELRLRVVVRNAEGTEIWRHESRGATLDAVAEETTWSFGEALLARSALPPVTEAQRAACGTDDDDACREALMAELAVLNHGLLVRLDRLGPTLAARADTAMWGPIAKLPRCIATDEVATCFNGSAFPGTPPALLSPSRRRLWEAFARLGGATDGAGMKSMCALTGDRDPLVGGIALLVTADSDCGGDRVICGRTDTFLWRQDCLMRSSMSDEPETALRYYEDFSTEDLAPPSMTALLSMNPMRKDVELARRWLERVRFRTVDTDPLLANGFVRIELARRDAREATIWARRSVNAEWREGQAMLVQGTLRSGLERQARGIITMLTTDSAQTKYAIDVLARPALQPLLVLGDKGFAEAWLRAIGGREAGLPSGSQETIAIARAARDGVTPARCAAVDMGGAYALEWLYLCRKWAPLVALADERHEEGYGALATGFLLGDALLELSRLDRAEEVFSRVEADPVARVAGPASSILALERLGRIAERKKDPKTAAARYRELLRIWPEAGVAIPAVRRAAERLRALGGG
jgi:serine/threonine protein kinase